MCTVGVVYGTDLLHQKIISSRQISHSSNFSLVKNLNLINLRFLIFDEIFLLDTILEVELRLNLNIFYFYDSTTTSTLLLLKKKQQSNKVYVYKIRIFINNSNDLNKTKKVLLCYLLPFPFIVPKASLHKVADD